MKKASFKKIVFIGAGNVATSLTQALKKEREIIQVYSKTLAHARTLGLNLTCSYTNDLKKISPDANIYIIAVKDDAIAEVCRKLKLPGKIVIHTSGSMELSILKKVSEKIGVLWPMHSFAGKSESLSHTPFFIEASDRKTEKELTALVKELKGKPYYVSSEKRAIIHMAAVFMNNFPNHLFTIVEILCKEAGIPFNLFLPIAQETVDNIANQSPALTQTGPAIRNDKRIINKHIALLSKEKLYPEFKEIYKVLTKSIIEINRGRRKKL